MADTTREAVEQAAWSAELDATMINANYLQHPIADRLREIAATLRALLTERDAARAEVDRLTAALADADERQWGSIGAGAVAHLTEMYPAVRSAMTSSACTSLRNWINNRVKAALADAERRGKEAGLREAVQICKRIRNEEAEGEDQAVGALLCALSIMDAVHALPEPPREEG